MQAPLLSEEVWIAFDHVARLRDAFLQEPDQFVAFPAPVGPRGRGFMPVLVGLGIAKGAPERAASVRLIDYLLRPETQITTVQELGFYPTLEMQLPENIQPGIRAIGEAMTAQAHASNALPASPPSGLGTRTDAFDQIYRDAFQQIVLDGSDIAGVLARQAQKLEALVTETEARCAPPDSAGDGPCPVE
jgi:multiple sugar transport system substrate-binding protein